MNKTSVPFFDLKRQHKALEADLMDGIREVLQNTAFAGGPYVEKFEEALASFCGTQYAVGVNSGTSALHLALLSLGIKAGDEVILPANTFIATAWAVSI